MTRLFALASLSLAACCSSPPPAAPPVVATAVVLAAPAPSAAAAASAPLPEVAAAVLRAFAARDGAALAALVDPRRGVRFSPYSHVDTDTDVVLRPAALRGAFGDGRMRTWGSYDDSGDPIRETFAGYVGRFVTDVDFTKGEAAIDHLRDPGNRIDNAREVYPEATLVQLYVPPSGTAGDGDWRLLTLAFEGPRAPALVGVIHGEWTP